MAEAQHLSNGIEILLEKPYNAQESGGMIVTIVMACFSLAAIVLLLVAVLSSAIKSNSALNRHLFFRTHVAGYFFSLLLCHLFQAIASIMSARWVSRGGLVAGSFCNSQGILKHVSDVGTAIWTFIIAMHTFCLLFCEIEKMNIFTLWGTLIGGWAATGTIVISGPAVVNLGERGPYYGISGYWCWISPQYKVQQIALSWLLLILAAFFSFVFYILIFLRLRGVVVRNGWKVRLAKPNEGNADKSPLSEHGLRIAAHMLIYPVAYTVLILPIVSVRLSERAGSKVTLGGMIFSDAVYQLFGLANVILIVTTRPVLSRDSLLFKGWHISWPFERSLAEECTQRPTPPPPSQPPPQSHLPPQLAPQLAPAIPSQQTRHQRISSGSSEPTWTRREIMQPPEIIIRNSIESIYSVYSASQPQHPQFDPPLSSHWSPDTPHGSANR